MACLLPHALDESAPTHLLVHPALENGFGRHPEVEIRIELSAQTFDIEQGFLQQHQLRLDLDIEAARGLEQAHQDQTERNLLERPIKKGLANRPDRSFKGLHPGAGRHPARLDMQFGHPSVVTPKKRQEVLCQVVLVEIRQRAHDAEIQCDVAVEVFA